MDYREEEYKELDEFVKFKLGEIHIEYEERAWGNFQQKMAQSKPFFKRFSLNRFFMGAALLLLMFLVSGTFIALYQMKAPLAASSDDLLILPEPSSPSSSGIEAQANHKSNKGGQKAGLIPEIDQGPSHVESPALSTDQPSDFNSKTSAATALRNIQSDKSSPGDSNPSNHRSVAPPAFEKNAFQSETKGLSPSKEVGHRVRGDQVLPEKESIPELTQARRAYAEKAESRKTVFMPTLERKAAKPLEVPNAHQIKAQNYQIDFLNIKQKPLLRRFYLGWNGGLAHNHIESARDPVISGFTGITAEAHFGKRLALMTGFSYHEVTFEEPRFIVQPTPNYVITFGAARTELLKKESRLRYVEIPTELKYKIKPYGRLQFFASLGFSSVYVLSQQDQLTWRTSLPITLFQTETQETRNEVLTQAKKFQFFNSLNFGAGATYHLSNRLALQIQPVYRLATKGIGEPEARHSSFNLRTQVLFKF